MINNKTSKKNATSQQQHATCGTLVRLQTVLSKKLETFMEGRPKKKEKFGAGITERCQ